MCRNMSLDFVFSSLKRMREVVVDKQEGFEQENRNNARKVLEQERNANTDQAAPKRDFQ